MSLIFICQGTSKAQRWPTVHLYPWIYISFPHLFMSIVPSSSLLFLSLTKNFNQSEQKLIKSWKCARVWQALGTGKEVPGYYHRVIWLSKYRSEKNHQTIHRPNPLPKRCKVNPLLTIQCYAYPKCDTFFPSCSADSKAPSLNALPWSLQGTLSNKLFLLQRTLVFFQFVCSCDCGCIPQCWYQRQTTQADCLPFQS